MSSKGKRDQDIVLKVGDNTVQKQCKVAEILAEYFSRIAEGIRDISNNFSNGDIRNHESVNKSKRNIEQTHSNFVRSSLMRFLVL